MSETDIYKSIIPMGQLAERIDKEQFHRTLKNSGVDLETCPICGDKL